MSLLFLDEKLASPKDLPHILIEKIAINNSGEFIRVFEEETRWHSIISEHFDTLKGHDAYRAALQAMNEDEKVARHLNTLVGTKSQTRIESDDFLRSFLSKLLKDQQNVAFQEAVFEENYGTIEDYFYRDLLDYRYISPLSNYIMDTENIELTPNFRIIRMTTEQKEGILSNSVAGPFSFLPFRMLDPEYALEIHTQEPKVFGHNVPADQARFPDIFAQKNFDDAVSALRLFKNGDVAYSILWRKPMKWEPSGGEMLSTISGRGIVFGSRYHLSKDEIPAFLAFWNFFRRIREKKNNRIEIALRRLNFSYERVEAQDRLIDYLIGFEALLLEGGQELEYRLSLRSSALLGSNAEEKKKIFAYIKKAYRERSNIVHGGQVKNVIKMGGVAIQFGQFVYTIGEHLKAAIKEFIKLCEQQNESQVLKSLDEKILSGGKYILAQE